MKTTFKGANDAINAYSSDKYLKFNMGLVLTQGTKALTDKFQCYWLLDVIASYQFKSKMRNQDMQVWKFERSKTGDGGKVTCEDGNNNLLVSQRIPYSDIDAQEATFWLIDKTILLPTEY